MTSLYSPKAILTKQPVAVASGVRTLLHCAVLVGILSLDAAALAAISLAVEIGLGLFTWQSVYPTAKVDAATGALKPEEEPLADPVLIGEDEGAN